MEPSKLILELKDISAGYDDKKVLKDVNLKIYEKDFIGIIGPNGGGKTTLLKVILGLLKPYSGSITFHRERKNLFGYLPQNNSIDKKFPISITEVVLSGAIDQKRKFFRYSREEYRKAHQLLERYGLGDYLDSPVGELSGGQLQRVLLCRSVISSPHVLILDEPTTFVDSSFEKEFYALLRELNEEMAIVMVSHDIGTICSYVKTIACVNGELHYHPSNSINSEQLKSYNCPLELISHGKIPHRVLPEHD